MKQETTMTRTAIMDKLTAMGVPFKKKDSLQSLKDTLETALNERHYEKYGRPTENAMEQEAQKLMENLVNALTTKKEEENTMNTENNAPATIETENSTPATMNTENKEENTMTTQNTENAKNAEKKAQKEAEKKAKAEKKAAEKAKKEAEKRAAAEKAEAEKRAVLQAVTAIASDNGLTMLELPKKKAYIVKMGAHRVFEVYEVRNGYKLFVADKYVNTGWWMDILGSITGIITMNYNSTYYMKHWFCLNAENLLTVLGQM